MKTNCNHSYRYEDFKGVGFFAQSICDIGTDIIAPFVMLLAKAIMTFSEAGFRYVRGSSGGTRLMLLYYTKW